MPVVWGQVVRGDLRGNCGHCGCASDVWHFLPALRTFATVVCRRPSACSQRAATGLRFPWSGARFRSMRAGLSSTDAPGQTRGAHTQSNAERYPEKTREQAVSRGVLACGREHLQGGVLSPRSGLLSFCFAVSREKRLFFKDHFPPEWPKKPFGRSKIKKAPPLALVKFLIFGIIKSRCESVNFSTVA